MSTEIWENTIIAEVLLFGHIIIMILANGPICMVKNFSL